MRHDCDEVRRASAARWSRSCSPSSCAAIDASAESTSLRRTRRCHDNHDATQSPHHHTPADHVLPVMTTSSRPRHSRLTTCGMIRRCPQPPRPPGNVCTQTHTRTHQRLPCTAAVFKSRLKTFLFSRAFCSSLLTNTLPGPAPLKLRPYGAIQICLILLFLLKTEPLHCL